MILKMQIEQNEFDSKLEQRMGEKYKLAYQDHLRQK